jgi:hypothetical protein
MRRWLGISLLLLVFGVLRAAAVSTAQTVVAGNLNSAPNTDASVVTAIPNATGVSIIERQGGWYHVRLDSGQDGWLPMTSIRFNSGTTGTAQSTDWSGLFQSGRSGAGGTTATTGVRGLNTGDIANAVPDPKAVDELNQWQATPDQAKTFAAALPLTADPKIDYLKKVKP